MSWLTDWLKVLFSSEKPKEAPVDTKPSPVEPTPATPPPAPILVPVAPTLVFPQVFDPEFFIPDELCCPYQPSSFNTQAWLDKNAGALKGYTDPATGKTAAQLINEAADAHGVSRRLLVVTLQREQSLVDPRHENAVKLPPTIMDRACGQAIFDPQPNLPPKIYQKQLELKARYKGFANQLMGAAKTYAKWFGLWQPGVEVYPVNNVEEKDRNGVVTHERRKDRRIPRNSGSYSLLMFTPHDDRPSVGSHLSWRIMKKVIALN
jgi:hypothetical protein